MIELKFKDDANHTLSDRMHKALVGSPGYICDEIVLGPTSETTNTFSLIVGKNNSDDMSINVNGNVEIAESKPKITAIISPKLTYDERWAKKKKVISYAEKHGYDYIENPLDHSVDSFAKMKGTKQDPILSFHDLSETLNVLAMCDLAYFCKGWRNSVDCRRAHSIAADYQLSIIDEEDFDNDCPKCANSCEAMSMDVD